MDMSVLLEVEEILELIRQMDLRRDHLALLLEESRAANAGDDYRCCAG